MRLVMVGSGYVGLVSGACLSDFGHTVVCVDKDAAKIAGLRAGRIPIFEPGLDALVAANAEAGRLAFSTDLAGSVAGADAIFIGVGTPSRRGDGFADLSYVYAAAEEIAQALTGPAVIVTKSTVPVGTGDEVERRVRAIRPELDIAVVSNPEFLREGSAIEDFKRPDRVVVGTEDPGAQEAMREVYRPLSLNETPILFTARRTSELIKYAGNAFLAMKITFINEMADLAEAVGADVQDVARGIGLDKRIGAKFLHAGPGYGGSCFPKDTVALIRTAEQAGAPSRLIETVVQVNDARKRAMARRIIEACGGDVRGRRIAILGLTFKPNTDDMREAPSLAIVPALEDAGAEIVAFDPEGMDEARGLLPGIAYAEDEYAAAQGADAVVILTEWNRFRALDLGRMRTAMRGDAFVDLRNVYSPEIAERRGFRYSGIGQGTERRGPVPNE